MASVDYSDHQSFNKSVAGHTGGNEDPACELISGAGPSVASTSRVLLTGRDMLEFSYVVLSAEVSNREFVKTRI
jgi:hypothetical protein